MKINTSFPYFKQADQMDCGPTCLRMVSKYYGKNYRIQTIRDNAGINREGVNLLGISEAAEKLGFRTTGVKIGLEALETIVLPCILHWNQNHFVVLYKVSKGKYHIADPAKGLITYTTTEFKKHWVSNSESELGILLLLEPTPEFYKQEGDSKSKISFAYVFEYLFKYKKLLFQLVLGLGVGTLLQLILPFLTQSVVDIGINTRNLNFVYIVLIAQTTLLIGRMSVDFIRSWILLHISTRVNISILTDFLIKLMKLPMSFFDTKMTGDIMQRMSDQKRIESFLTGTSLSTLFSLFNLVVFTVVLLYYDAGIFMVLAISSVLYSLWVVAFLKRRRELDFKRFDLSSKNQSAIVQLITGMQEIKLNNCEQQKRWEWEYLQAGLFKFSVKSLSLGQFQQAGAFLINESKNIIITFLTAKAVIDGNITLGGMMAVQYIVGQINSPIEQLLGFIQSYQDATISMERLNEINELENEEPSDQLFTHQLPEDKSIWIKNMSFTYPGAGNEPVLRNIDMYIPQGKTTAIVGMSGSGKTTLLKLLLRFYEIAKGEIYIGKTPLHQISYRFWRGKCGVVMQDGFIFSDTIARNIAVGDEIPNPERLQHAIQMANINDFIQGLPLGIHTKIGAEGNGISQGQKQRLLIARAVYKNPDFIFFDEATNALDANNEKTIVENLKTFFAEKTVIVVAHRLSTVREADHIVVIEEGEIKEQGNHETLTKLRGRYYELVKNQLSLGE